MKERIAGLVGGMGSGPVFVHADAFRVARLVEPVRDRGAYLDAHVTLLRDATEGRSLWCPTFNYEFGKSRVFDVRSSESHLGPITERFRVASADWRTPIPIFSVAGTGKQPSQEWGPETDPFGADSMFSELIAGDGVILYYGDTFHYNTLVHQAERYNGGPVYRYDKIFPGVVIDAAGTSIDGNLLYHVRPLGTGLDYDWPRLLAEAIDAGACRRLEGTPEILAASAKALYELWVSDLKKDPCALLDEKSRKWVEPAIDELGRRFVLTDFEAPA